jgi:prophage DNA circulation protein
MGTWADIIQYASFRNRSFEFLSSRDDFGNEHDAQELYARNGARHQFRNAAPRRISCTVPIIEEDYPDKMFDLLEALPGGPAELIHPIFGAMQAVALTWTVTHDPEDGVDCATIQIEFQEDIGDKTVTRTQSTVAARTGLVRYQAELARDAAANYRGWVEALEMAGLIASIVASGPDAVDLAINDAIACAELLEEMREDYSVLEIQTRINATLGKIQSVIDRAADFESVEQYELSVNLTGIANALERLGDELANQKPPLVTFKVENDTPLVQWVFDTYGDPERIDEVMALNTISDPLRIAAGAELKGYAR